ncbi:hypothetical protein PGQ11_010205 [Apiospora arundinis]|uniref:Uncharacterized protein n=1 Tax=Apiospora arundinis TaxID=335852 RepID=A0ABR2I955_9PEZI
MSRRGSLPRAETSWRHLVIVEVCAKRSRITTSCQSISFQPSSTVQVAPRRLADDRTPDCRISDYRIPVRDALVAVEKERRSRASGVNPLPRTPRQPRQPRQSQPGRLATEPALPSHRSRSAYEQAAARQNAVIAARPPWDDREKKRVRFSPIETIWY